ncbi:hypothetical protein ACP3W9_00355 [Vibrio anguillarum]
MKSIAHELTVLVDKSKPFRSLLIKAEVGGSVELQYGSMVSGSPHKPLLRQVTMSW